MFSTVKQILATAPVDIFTMERRQELAKLPLTLNGNPAKLIDLEDNHAVIVDTTTGMYIRRPWDATTERQLVQGRMMTLLGKRIFWAEVEPPEWAVNSHYGSGDRAKK